MPTHDHSPAHPLATALALSLGAAIALGLSRFSYGLLLPPMRADLGWSYLLAGAMNTFNALGYFLGALATPALMRRLGVWRLLIAGCVLASVFMLMSGLVSDTTTLFLQRVCAGVASAFIFIAGGVLAARLGSMHSQRAGFYIGLYYGGTGFGIALSALLVPAALAAAQEHGAAHAWQWPWLALGIACLLATAIMALPAKAIGEAPRALDTPRRFAWRDFAPSLAGYFMFGVGYIGYMTFVIALLKQQGMPPGAHHRVLHPAGPGGSGVVAHLGPHARPLQRRRIAGDPECRAGRGEHPAGADQLRARRLPLRPGLRRRVPVGGGLDDGPGAA